MSVDDWAADTPVSLPEPIIRERRNVPMFGFVFTEQGLFHDLTEADHEYLRTPTFAPPPEPGRTVYEDGL